MAAPSFPSVKSAASRSPARSFGSSSLRADYKYKDLLPPARLFNFSYRDRAVAELGKK